ncbi:MAG: putative Ig domain-containing protein [Planctomycetaceae bacterium]
MIYSLNEAPEFVSEPAPLAGVDQPWSYQAEAIDPNGDVLVYSLLDSPAGMSITSAGYVTWTPTTTGTFRLSIQADDQRGGRAVQEITLTISDNSPAEITSTPENYSIVNEEYTYEISVNDPDVGDTVTVTLDAESLARGMTLTGTTLSWTPTVTGEFEVRITAVDQDGAGQVQIYTLHIIEEVIRSQAPVFNSQPKGPAVVGEEWTYELDVTDPDGDQVTLSLVSGSFPTGMTLTGTTVSWTPNAVSTGELVVIQAEDPHGSISTQTFELPVVDTPTVNDAPVISSIPSLSVPVGEQYQYQLDAHDPNGDPITYSITLTDPVASSILTPELPTSVKDSNLTGNEAYFSITGPGTITEGTDNADFTLSYTGLLLDGETASIDLTHAFKSTSSADYTNTLQDAISTAISGNSLLSLTGSTLTITGALKLRSLTVILVMLAQPILLLQALIGLIQPMQPEMPPVAQPLLHWLMIMIRVDISRSLII